MEHLLERRGPLGYGGGATTTGDNGTEFHGYAEIEAATGVESYFAIPYHAWERGANENINVT